MSTVRTTGNAGTGGETGTTKAGGGRGREAAARMLRHGFHGKGGAGGPQDRPALGAVSPARLAALGRAELTLLLRNRNGLFMALLMPALMLFVLRSVLAGMPSGDLPMGAGAATLIGGTGMTLLLVVYMGLVATYTARREELVLKRLRTGEATDPEILAGAALPAAVIALVQCAVLTAGGVAVLDVPAPERPELLLLGVLAAVPLMAGLSALTSAVTRTVESAGLTTLPLFLVTVLGSGMMTPRDALPGPVGDLCELLPFSGVMEFVRAGWLGTDAAGDLFQAGVMTLVWAIITVSAVGRWFRWEPRR
ncbi:ABC transporter permease [Streptomyces sp. NPDC101118]|uniref:ABC transporter permease n=1 Tax=Streptomyces sp. NPDC101118 TaxID=3366109 RepID=UPI00382579AD